MKKGILVGKIIGVIVLCIFAVGMSYFVTRHIEKARYSDINLLVTFEDTKEFTLENTKKMDKEEALKTYPYIFKIENKGKRKADFDIKITDSDESNVDREKLNYIVIKNDDEIKSGKLSDIKETDSFISNNIDAKKTDTYKVYIYLTSEVKDAKYTYSLSLISK